MKIFIFIDSRNILTNKRIYSPFEIFAELLELLQISLSSRKIETKRNEGKEITSFSLESTYVSIDGCTVERGGVVEKLRATGTRWAAKRSKYNWHASHPRRWNRRWNRERPIITHSKARRTVQRPSLDRREKLLRSASSCRLSSFFFHEGEGGYRDKQVRLAITSGQEVDMVIEHDRCETNPSPPLPPTPARSSILFFEKISRWKIRS